MSTTSREQAVLAPGELFGLAGKVVVVTGASSGLGARFARVLATAGAQVVLTARREHELAELAAGLHGALVIPGDITSEAHRELVVSETIGRHGRVDVLVNNAGTAISAPAVETGIQEFRELLEIDLTAQFAMAQLIGPSMIAAGRGSIVNIASLGAERCVDRYPLAAYSAAKAGLVAITRSLAAEWGRWGVRVNAVGPAFFPTRLSGHLEDPDLVSWIERHTALRRTARIDELDGTVLFLASDASSFITGQHLLVDGGWSVY